MGDLLRLVVDAVYGVAQHEGADGRANVARAGPGFALVGGLQVLGNLQEELLMARRKLSEASGQPWMTPETTRDRKLVRPCGNVGHDALVG